MGVVTGKGLMCLVRERYGRCPTNGAPAALLVPSLGTICAEFAGVAAGMQIPGGPGPAASVPLAAAAVNVLVLRGSFGRVEHVLLDLSAIFAAYVVSGRCWRIPPGGDRARARRPGPALTHAAVLATVATVGARLAPCRSSSPTPSTSACP